MTKIKNIEDLISRNIKNRFKPFFFNILNESDKHKNHLLNKKTQSHFFLHIVSDVFIGKSKISRHMLVYKSLQDFLKSDVHALRIKTDTTDEFKKKLK